MSRFNCCWSVYEMCHQNSCAHLSAEEATAGEESLLIYCKPVEPYNILLHRAQHNPSFLRRCLHYKIRARRKRRLRAGIVIFNYRDYSNMLQKTEVTEDFSCPFCMMQCAGFKVTEDYQVVNVSVKIDTLTSEIVAGGVDLRLQTFFFSSKPRNRKRKSLVQHEKQVNIQFKLDSPEVLRDVENKEFPAKDIGERASKLSPGDIKFQIGGTKEKPLVLRQQIALNVLHPVSLVLVFQLPWLNLLQTVSVKSVSGSDAAVPAAVKSRKLTMERSDTRICALLFKSLFYHSHRVQPMAIEQVMLDQDSEDEVDDDMADFEDQRMLDDFVDVSKDEKKLMHLWNSFVRKQRVLADGHVPWECEAFSTLHGRELVLSPALIWCWRLFVIKLWNHGLLDGCMMNNCNMILERCRDDELDDGKS